MTEKVHATYRWNSEWKCEACDFTGNQNQAIEHAVRHQYIVLRQQQAPVVQWQDTDLVSQ